ncbi:hydroxyacid dehydrogenase [bacterium]|nr:hydroxyacid dehydrogenase [bacterium]
MRVHVMFHIEDDEFRDLQGRISDGIQLSMGDPPEDYEIAIGGRIRDEALDVPSLRAVIIPWAGPPERLTQQLQLRPHLTAHNLHHNASATAEMAVALLMSAAKALMSRDRDFRANGWPARMWADHSAICLEGKTAVILGYGSIGQRVGNVCRALGMTVRGVRRKSSDEVDGVPVHAVADLDKALDGANVLVVCLPETPESIGLIGERELAQLQSPSIVVNVGRGPVIDEEAFFNALRDKRIDAAGLDVWWQYPSNLMSGESSNRPSRFVFHELDNVVLSPHRGGLTGEDMDRRLNALAELLNAAAAGKPIPNRIDVNARY